MFHRFQDKQQGFAKEQRVADAQLASLRQLGLIGPEKKGFTSAWGGIEPIASTKERPPSKKGPKSSTQNVITAATGGELNERTFPEKGESTIISSPGLSLHRRRLATSADSCVASLCASVHSVAFPQ